MKKIKEAIINADPRMKGLLVVMIAYIGIVATTLNAGATNQIDNYVETIDVKVQDGNQDQKDYLIRQASVSSVLDDLKIKYDMEKYNAHIKLQVLDEIKEKLNGKNGVNNKNGNK